MPTLDEIGNRNATDRASSGWHDYLHTYDEVFGHLRDQPIRLLEIGVLGGAGIRTWAEWLTHPNAMIYGMDIETFRYAGCADPRVYIIEADASNPSINTKVPFELDVVIDDGSHFVSQQVKQFNLLWPHVKRGGYYTIEDLHTYASPQHCDVPGMNVMDWIHKAAVAIQAKGPLGQAKRVPGDSDVEWILIRKGLCIIRKAK